MTLSLNQLLAMVWRSITAPREGAAEVLALGVPKQALWLILLIVVVLSIILAQLTALIAAPGEVMMESILSNPVVAGSIQLGLLVVIIFAVFWIGRAMGGTGSFEESMLLMSWLQFIMVCVQVVQTVAMITLPPLAGLIGIAALALFFWLMTTFVAVLHGFRSLAQVFVMIVVSGFTLAFLFSMLLAIFGFEMQMPTGGV
ncbi:MAG: Yip1 family protein [Pseudomonadota bacterium]